MDNEVLRRVQLTQLEIAKEFKRICDENHLRYIMEGGTLLGAVRHQGFIPWDDDMDFSMPREDYEKFFAIASKMKNSGFEPVEWKLNREYPHPFGKFVKSGTVYREEKMDRSYGIYVDVFPFDNWPDNASAQKRIKYLQYFYRGVVRAKCGFKTYRANNKFVFSKWIKNLPFIITSVFVSKERMVNAYEKVCTSWNGETTEVMTCQCDMPAGAWCGAESIFNHQVEMTFEDTTFKAPAEYDKFLTDGYGDYMKLPPVEKRGNQHLIVELDFGE